MNIRSCTERLDEASWHFLASLAPSCPAALDVGLVALDHRHPRHREVKER